MNNYPKISVCIPTYNYGRFISASIESVLAQTFQDFELIIVDNCSTDDTEKIVSHYFSSCLKIKYVCNTENIGMTANWNRCLALSSGEYVKILCADDLLRPDCLQKSVEILDVNRNVELMATARLLVDENLLPGRTLRYDRSNSHCAVVTKLS